MQNSSLAPIPLGLVRSALFGTTKNTFQSTGGQMVAAHNVLGTKIAYKGPVLNQYHSTLWQSIMLLSREQRSNVVSVSGDRLMKLNGMSSRSSNNREILMQRLGNMVGATIQYQTLRHKYLGTLLVGATRDEMTGHFEVEINRKMIDLLGDEVLYNNLERKIALGGNQIARWLHDHFSSHQKIYPVSVIELYELSGSNMVLKKFRYELRKSLNLLKTGQDPLLKSWAIDKNDKVTAEKSNTKVVLIPHTEKYRDWKASKDVAVHKARNMKADVNL